jgi:serine/threonine-protein kinase
MISEHSERDPFELLAESFLARYRAGERPAVSEYARQYPELAGQILELFPALVLMEQHRPGAARLARALSDFRNIPERLGEYRILREIGRGGMGVVYEAVQESLGRQVALKVLPFNTLISPTHLERFRREARAAAQLHHTNIVPVFGVGECDGFHYYAMQFIHGQSLDVVLQEVKRLRGNTSGSPAPAQEHERSLSLSAAHGLVSGRFIGASERVPERAETGAPVALNPVFGFETGSLLPSGRSKNPVPKTETGLAETGSSRSSTELTGSEAQYSRSVARVGLQVAEALVYAHEHGVLHRDVKPSNLLLDTAGRIWVTDFGLAKAEGSDELTYPGDIVGTLRYMAPERFQGRSDPRSDIYSLGMTLFELLTLRPAFEDTDRARLMRRVAQEEPPSLRKIDSRIPRDLETVVCKAIAKDPGDRYASAEGLAEDLRRFLADRPIQARRTPPHERVWRWCRRNPMLAGLAAALLFSLLGGLAGVTWEWRRAEVNFRDARHQRDEADQQRNLAEANARKAHQAFDEAFTQVSESKLIDVPGAQPLRHQLLQAALRYYQDFLAQRHDDPALQADLTAAHFRVASLFLALDQGNQALAELRAGLDLADTLLPPYSSLSPSEGERAQGEGVNPDLPLRLAGFARSIRRVHYTLWLSSEPLRDDGTLPRAIRRWQSFARDYPGEAGFRSDLALLYLLHGETLRNANRVDDALASFQSARDLSEKLVGEAPAMQLYQALLDQAYSETTGLLTACGRTQEREAVHRAAVAFFDQQASAHPIVARLRLSLASALNDLAGFLLRSTGRVAEAEQAIRRAIALLEALVAQTPENADYRRELETSYVQLGTLLDHAAAEQAYRKSLALSEQLAANFPDVPGYRQSWAHTAMLLGTFLLGRSRLSEAEPLLRQSVRLRERLTADFPDHIIYPVGLWRSRRQLVWLLLAGCRAREAEPLLQQSEKELEELAARKPQTVAFSCCLADIHRARGHLLALTGRSNEAEASLRRCCSCFQRQPEILRDAEFDFLTETEACIAAFTEFLNTAGRYKDAEIVHRQLIQLYGEMAALHPDDLEFWQRVEGHWEGLGHWLHAMRRPRAAAETYERALACSRHLLDHFPATDDCTRHHAEVARWVGDRRRDARQPAAAVRAYREAIDAAERLARRSTLSPSASRVASAPGAASRELLDLYLQLGHAASESAELRTAESAYRRALDLCERRAAEAPADLARREDLAHGLRWLAFVLPTSRPGEAESLHRQAFEVFEELAHRAPRQARYRVFAADAQERIGDLCAATQQPRQAELAYRHAFLMTQEGVRADTAMEPWFQNHMRWTYRGLIGFLKRMGRPDEARDIERRACDYYLKMLDAAIAAQPKEWRFWQARSRFQARLHHWAAAAADLAAAVTLAPNDDDLAFEYAALLLLSGDSAGYQRCCADKLARLRRVPDEAEDRLMTHFAVKMFGLAADSGVDPGEVVRLAEGTVAANPSPWYLHTLALALYRAGKPAAAIERARQSLNSPGACQLANWSLLALAHQQLGNAAEAQKWIDQASHALSRGIFDDSLTSHEWLETQILLSEARLRLKAAAVRRDQATIRFLP